jgi:hypothetical protein
MGGLSLEDGITATELVRAHHSAADHAATSSAAHRTVCATGREFASHSARWAFGSDRPTPPTRRADQEQPDLARKAVPQPFALAKTTRVMPQLENAHRRKPAAILRSTVHSSQGLDRRSALIFLNAAQTTIYA